MDLDSLPREKRDDLTSHSCLPPLFTILYGEIQHISNMHDASRPGRISDALERYSVPISPENAASG